MWSRYAVFMLLMGLAGGCASTPPAGSAPPVTPYYTSSAAPDPVYPPSDPPSDEVDIQVFYEELAPYGNWVPLEGYGRVWYPHGVPPDWRPYTDGRWVYTEAGWTWVSDWEWGWAPFHYGRWLHAPVYGWVWVPGTVWGPAWVVWHHGPEWVGWAPLPPAVVWGPHWGLHLTHIERHIHPSSYCFVRTHHLTDRHVRRHIVSSRENPRLVRTTRNVTKYTTVNKRVMNQSIDVDNIEQASKQRVPRLRLVDSNAPPGRRKTQVQEEDGQVRLFRPTVARPSADAERPRSLPASRPVTPDTTPTTPAVKPGREIPARLQAPAAPEPVKQSREPQEERPRQPSSPPAARSQPAPPGSSVSVPQGRSLPAGELPAARSRSRPQPLQSPGPQDQGPGRVPQPRQLAVPPQPAPRGGIVTVPPRRELSPGRAPQSSGMRQEYRSKTSSQGRQDEEQGRPVGRTFVPPTAVAPSSSGASPYAAPSAATPDTSSGNTSRRPAGSRPR